MKRIVTYLALLAMLANNASAGLLVQSTKVGTKTVSGTSFDVWKVVVTGFDGAQNVAGNYVQGIDFNTQDSTFGLVPTGGAVLAAAGTAATAKNNFSSVLAGGGDFTADGTSGSGSWFNFDSYAGTFTRTGTAAATTKVTATMFAGDPVANGLRPVDVTVGGTDDGIDQTLLGQIFVSAGGSATFKGTAGFNQGGTAAFTFSVGGGGGPTTDPISVSAVPVSGTSRTVGQTVAVTNAAAVAPNARDAATISGTAVTTNAGSAGVFSAPGISNGALNAGSTQTATVGFNGAGLLNGFVANGNLHFDVASGPSGAGSGAGAYNYPLTATVAGNVGDGTAPVPVGGSYAGLGSTSGLANNGALVHIPSTAAILAGSNNVGGATTVSMVWSLRAANEQFPGGTTPPLPSFAYALTSDKVDITGVDDKFVLQMSYDPSLLTGNELDDFNSGKLFLASFDGTKWVNTVLLNSDGGAGATKVNGAWSGQTALSTWGADLTNNVVWAVVDHNSLFASVPEPSTIIIGLMGLVGLVGFARRRRG